MSFPRLRWFQQAGGKLPNPCIEEIRSSFPQVKYYLMYGQTEATARLSYLLPERLADKLGSIGRGLSSTRLEVLKANGSPVAWGRGNLKSEGRTRDEPRMDTDGHGLEPRNTLNTRKEVEDGHSLQAEEESEVRTSKPSTEGNGDNGEASNPVDLKSPQDAEIGEIVASGDNIALGYWNDPVETAKFFRDGKLYTGDLARVDEDGFIFIVERERDMIKSGGNRVSAKEVEDVIAAIPEVVEVAVVGAPHELLGEAIKAFVVPAPKTTVTPTEIEAHCRKHLPAHKTPEEIIFLQGMPHNGAGKVMKAELKKMAQRENASNHEIHEKHETKT